MDERFETVERLEAPEGVANRALGHLDLTTDQARSAGLISVGKVAAATGISAHALRMWERRYGTPRPVRLSSGHRRYTPDQVQWLRLVAKCLDRGDRPGRVLRQSSADLRKVLDDAPSS